MELSTRASGRTTSPAGRASSPMLTATSVDFRFYSDEGEWLNNRSHGFGVFTYANGHKYEGFWKADKHDGKGKESWPDGS